MKKLLLLLVIWTLEAKPIMAQLDDYNDFNLYCFNHSTKQQESLLSFTFSENLLTNSILANVHYSSTLNKHINYGSHFTYSPYDIGIGSYIGYYFNAYENKKAKTFIDLNRISFNLFAGGSYNETENLLFFSNSRILIKISKLYYGINGTFSSNKVTLTFGLNSDFSLKLKSNRDYNLSGITRKMSRFRKNVGLRIGKSKYVNYLFNLQFFKTDSEYYIGEVTFLEAGAGVIINISNTLKAVKNDYQNLTK